MIAALLLAACLSTPLFDMSGPVCLRPTIECGCSECMSWSPSLANPSTGTPAAEWYEVLRTNPDSTTVIVGDTRWRNHAAYVDEDGAPVPAIIGTLWCFAWDSPFPTEGLTYTYQVLSCVPGACAVWGPDQMPYTAALYQCYANGAQVIC